MSKPFQILDDAARFDRLVDGELSEDEYRELLRALDEEPDGWRRCAMAFLEAQAWSKVLSPDIFRQVDSQNATAKHELLDSTLVPVPSGTNDVRASSVVDLTNGPSEHSGHYAPVTEPKRNRPDQNWARRNWLAPSKLLLACAGSFALAFLLGIGLERMTSTDLPGDASMARLSVDSNGSAVRRQHSDLASNTGSQVAAADSALEYFVGASGGGGESGNSVEIPLYNLGDEGALDNFFQPYHLPRNVRRSLERLGYDISEQRRIAPIQLLDGSPGLVPIDEVRITPVSRQAY